MEITTATAIPMAMDSEAALLRLMAWLSPSFPVGSFSYSHGLERAAHDGLVDDGEDLFGWIRSLLVHGSAWNDAVLLAESWREAGRGRPVAEVAELAEALAGSAERHMETTLLGAAFTEAAAAWNLPGGVPERCPYCVAVGAAAAAGGVPLAPALAAFLQSFASGLIQAAIRLGIAGQKEGLAVLARLEPVVLAVAARAARSTLDDLGSATLSSEIMAMRHETQHSRLFRS